MPLLILILIALVAGVLAGLVARRRVPAQPLTAPAGSAGLVVVVALGFVLAALTVLVRSADGPLGIDTSVANWADRHATGWSTHGGQVVTDLGGVWTVLVAGVLVVLVDWRRTTSHGGVVFVLTVVLGDKLLSVTLKELVDRARPDLNPVAATLGPSFPSGHSSTAAAFWAAAALVAMRWVPPGRRPLLVGGAVGVAVGVAASRVLLDVHWLTDVIAGLALGWAWFAACTVAFGGRLLGLATARAGRPA
jgi:membrane-associated phospholipid phosphatase